MIDAQVAHCERCGVPCRVADTANPDARLLQHSTTPHGLCPDCAATQFLKDSQMAQFLDDPSKLLSPPVQAQFARLMAAGNADAKPGELNWQRVVDNWSLPFKVQSKKRRRSAKVTDEH